MSTSNIIFPTCRFCGSAELPVGSYKRQAEADEAATLRCKCEQAREYQREAERIKRREENISKLRSKLDEFSEYHEKRDVEWTEALYNTVFTTGVAVLDGIISQVTFKFDRVKIAISTNSKGNLIVAFTYSESAKAEI